LAITLSNSEKKISSAPATLNFLRSKIYINREERHLYPPHFDITRTQTVVLGREWSYETVF